MTVRLSEVGEYSQRFAERPSAPEVPTQVVPTRATREDFRRRFGSLALTEVGPQQERRNGLGELVQVVT